MIKIHREFFDNGNLKNELYYDSETTIVSEIKCYDSDGNLMLATLPKHETKLDTLLSLTVVGFNKKLLTDASYIDEEALRAEESRERIERARLARIETERAIEEHRVEMAAQEAKRRASERYIGKTLKNGELY